MCIRFFSHCKNYSYLDFTYCYVKRTYNDYRSLFPLWKNVVVYSKWYGKLATVLFYLAIVISLITKQLGVTGFWSNLDMAVYCLALIATIFSLIMYIKCLYQDGFIDKSDLNKDAEQVIVKNKRKKKVKILKNKRCIINTFCFLFKIFY